MHYLPPWKPGPSVKPSFFLGIIGVPYAAFILGPVLTALYYQMNQVINKEAEFKGLWVGFRKHYWQAAGVYAIYTGVLLFACLIWSSVFVLEQFTLKILGFLFYLFLLLVASLYLPGFIVFQRNTLKKVIKKTLILFMDNTLVTIGAFLTLLLVGVAFAFLAPLLLFYGSFTGAVDPLVPWRDGEVSGSRRPGPGRISRGLSMKKEWLGFIKTLMLKKA